MSWSITTGHVLKEHVEYELGELRPQHSIDGPSEDQLAAAKRAALELLKTVPGPVVYVNLSGHAAGSGWQKGESSPDSINVAVGQAHEMPPGQG